MNVRSAAVELIFISTLGKPTEGVEGAD
jgi:hypothetical protein